MTPARRPALFALAASMVLTPASVVEACAGCRNPSLATSRGSEGPLAEGALRVGATLTATTVHVVHRAGCSNLDDCDELPVQPLHLHDQRFYPLELRIASEYGWSSRFGLEAQLPLRLVRASVDYTTPGGARYEPLDEGIHHRDETLAGIGDAWLLARAGGHVGGFWLAARSGVSIPLGRTEPNPFSLGDAGRRHQHIQFGSGTFDPIAVVEASRSLGDWSLELFAQGQASLYENHHGYRAPRRLHAGGALGTELGRGLAAFVGPEVFHEAAERWHGEIRQDASLGRSELLAALRLTLSSGDSKLDLGLRAPVYRHIVQGSDPEGRLSSPLIASVGFARVFGGQGKRPDL